MEEVQQQETIVDKELEGQIVALKFGEDRDPNKSANRVSYIHKGIPFAEKSIGKAALLDKSELSKKIETGVWYDCFVKLELENVCFVRVVGKTFKNRLVITPKRTAVLVLQQNEEVKRLPFHTPSAAMEYVITHRISDFDVIINDEDSDWQPKEW